MAKDDTERPPAPIYASWVTFNTFVDWVAGMQVIPHQIDRSLWQGKFNGAVGAQLMPGLRFLKLLDRERTTDRLEPLARADAEGRKKLVRDLMSEAYGAELVDNLPRMTPSMLSDALRALGTTPSTHRKAEAFFVNAAKALDLGVPANIAKKARNRLPGSGNSGRSAATANVRKTNRSRENGTTSRHQAPTPSVPPAPGAATRKIELRNGAGDVTLIVAVDLFKLDDQDRAFVLDLVSKFRDRRNEEPVMMEATNGPASSAVTPNA